MKDFRLYKEAIKEAVKEASNNDNNWNYTIKAVNKYDVKIGWGYLDYIGEREPFHFEMDIDEESGSIVGIHTSLHNYILIGETRWDDTNDIREAIRLAVLAIARTASLIY